MFKVLCLKVGRCGLGLQFRINREVEFACKHSLLVFGGGEFGDVLAG